MAREGVFVELVLGQAIFFDHHLGAQELAEIGARVTIVNCLAHIAAHAVFGGQRAWHAHRHAAHALDAGGDHDVHGARHHCLGRKLQGLLRGAALAIDRGARHALREFGRQHRVAGYVGRLLASLADATHDDVFDQHRIDAGAGNQRIENLCGQIGRMPARHATAFTTAGSARRGNNECFSHGLSPPK